MTGLEEGLDIPGSAWEVYNNNADGKTLSVPRQLQLKVSRLHEELISIIRPQKT